MNYCEHEWELKPGMECPSCRYDRVSSAFLGAEGVKASQEAVAYAISLLKRKEHKEAVLREVTVSNNYHAVKVAMQLHQKEQKQ